MIERADTDNDGLVSEDDFYSIITKKTFAAWMITVIPYAAIFLPISITKHYIDYMI